MITIAKLKNPSTIGIRQKRHLEFQYLRCTRTCMIQNRASSDKARLSLNKWT